MKSVAIIGGGITGLTAAFRLQSRGIPVTVYEAGARVGGVIQTLRRDGYLAESGPNTLLETSPKIKELITDAGLKSRLLYSDPRAANRYLVRNGRTIALPSSAAAFFRSPLFSTGAKLRLLREPFVRRAPAKREECVADFVRRRLGREFLDYAINPLVAGIYAGDPERLSVTHAFPKLHAVEQRYGSLILGQLLGARERKRRKEVSKQNAPKISFDDGLQVLPDTLAARLGTAVRLGASVHRVAQSSRGWIVTTKRFGHAERHAHDAVLFAVPAHRFAEMDIQTPAALDWPTLSRMHYPPVATVVLGFRRENVRHPLDGFGMLVPEAERCSILGAIFSSSLFPDRAPAGHVTLTCYLGGARAPELTTRPSADLIDMTRRDLARLLGATGRTTFEHTHIFPHAIPQYEVGFGMFKRLMEEIEQEAPGLFLGGHYRDGISLGDSIVAGFAAAERIENFLHTRQSRRERFNTHHTATSMAA